MVNNCRSNLVSLWKRLDLLELLRGYKIDKFNEKSPGSGAFEIPSY